MRPVITVLSAERDSRHGLVDVASPPSLSLLSPLSFSVCLLFRSPPKAFQASSSHHPTTASRWSRLVSSLGFFSLLQFAGEGLKWIQMEDVVFARSCQDGDIKVPKRHRQCVIESVRMVSLQKHMCSCSSHFKQL